MCVVWNKLRHRNVCIWSSKGNTLSSSFLFLFFSCCFLLVWCRKNRLWLVVMNFSQRETEKNDFWSSFSLSLSLSFSFLSIFFFACCSCHIIFSYCAANQESIFFLLQVQLTRVWRCAHWKFSFCPLFTRSGKSRWLPWSFPLHVCSLTFFLLFFLSWWSEFNHL